MGYIYNRVSTLTLRVLTIRRERQGPRMALSARKEMILSAIVEFYIETGEPVGSKYLVSILPITVSSATIRNEMAELSEMGYLEQPHTSAGRIPSDLGLRYYADKLLKSFAPSASEMLRVSAGIDHFEGDVKQILAEGCAVLSELTGTLAVATTPFFPDAVINNVQLLPIGKRSVLVVFSTSAGVFKSRIAKLQTDADYELFELFYNVCGANFIGGACSELCRADLQSVTASLGARSLDISPLLVSLFEAIAESTQAEVIVKGQPKLLASALRADAPKIIELTNQKEAMLRLLLENVTDGAKLRIGAENGYACLQNASLIISPYKAGENNAGVIAVIAPTKTDYAHVLPLVKYTSDVVGELITGNLESDAERTDK